MPVRKGARIARGLAAAAAVAIGAAGESVAADVAAARDGRDGREIAFFEARIRPVLVEACGKCHASTLPSPKGGLVLDTRAGLRQGGRSGPVVVPGKPGESRLLTALRYTDPEIEMPPSGKLPDRVIADFERWIAAGAVDPRPDGPAGPAAPAAKSGMSIEEGRAWWAFQPVQAAASVPIPASPAGKAWARTRIDAFIVTALEAKRLAPSPPADRATLAQRAYVDLLGFKPTHDEVRAFAADRSPRAFEALVDRLLASPHYGERWGRHWMDVARYGEDNPTSEATNQPYPFAWRYRDWIVEAINADVPYPRFVKLQIAADLMPDARRDDLRALGYLGAAPVYHKDQRLSADVIGGFATDDWDERIDAVSRGLLGLSVACARCHDHKFDPVAQQDYYGLMGVFASTARAERPLLDVPAPIETRYLATQRRLIDLRYSLDLLANETSTFTDVPGKKARWSAEVERLKAEATAAFSPHPALLASLERYWSPPPKREEPVAMAEDEPAPAADAADAKAAPDAADAADAKAADAKAAPGAKAAADAKAAAAGATGPRGRRRRAPQGSTAPFANAVFEAAQYIDASDPTYTFIVYKPGEARDMPFLRGGNYAAQGTPVPRRFPLVLARGDGRLTRGSGRLELAERIVSDAGALAARVIVNRVWGWHFGRPLVATASDFGTQGERPTHPALLDDLTARFIDNGWSLKWLHREIMLSAAYRQASRPRPEAEAIDPGNALLWRMNPRRLDIEAYRDSLLRAAGALDTTMGGVSGDLEGDTFFRRSIYGRISRGRPSAILALFDFPEAVQTSPGRDQTLTTLQQIYMMNNAFVRALAERIARGVPRAAAPARRIQALYRRVLARDPTPAERAAALAYLGPPRRGSLERYAQVLLSTNEMVFQP